ncbi:MAG: hypothetical protein Kow00127_19570 [Bacteroidales bacterium]
MSDLKKVVIIADHRLPVTVLKNLGKRGEVLRFDGSGLAYGAISSHPDIFLTPLDNLIIAAPNTPEKVLTAFDSYGVAFERGEFPVGVKYPATVGYNVVFSGNCLIHNFRYTDPAITRRAEDADLIHVDQGYTRCNLIPLKPGTFITSDAGIERVLKRHEFKVHHFEPEGILLPGFRHGFLGGCCGIFQNHLFLTGSLKHYSWGSEFRDIAADNDFDITELSEGPLIDAGSIFFIPVY